MPPNRPSRLSLEDCKAHAERLGGKCLSQEYTSSKKHTLWECKDGHQWSSTFNNVRLGHWCRKCFNLTQRLDINECQRAAGLSGGLCLSDKYVGNNKKMLWQCEFGHQWNSKYEHIKNGSWCPKCIGRGKYTIDDCFRIAKERDGKCLEIEYFLATRNMKWQCKHGHKWLAPFDRVALGSWCNKCNTHRIEDCIDFAATKSGKCLSSEYTMNKAPLLWECSEGHTWERAFTDTVNKGQWCWDCNEKLRIEKCYEECVDYAITKGGICLSDKYVGICDKMKWSCHKGHIWDAKFNDIKNCDHWCPHCSLMISKPQTKIYNAILAYFPDLKVVLNDTKIIKPMHLDIFIPSLKIGIEYDGEYWHYSDWAISKGSLEKMAIKDAKCRDMNIKLLRAREKDFKQDERLIMKTIYEFIKTTNEEISI